MSKDRGEELQDLHNQGEKDASEYKYEPPPNPGFFDAVDEAIDPVTPAGSIDRKLENREAYDEGYQEGRKKR
jgi:hypothetical protein